MRMLSLKTAWLAVAFFATAFTGCNTLRSHALVQESGYSQSPVHYDTTPSTLIVGGANGIVSRIDTQTGVMIDEFRAHDRAITILHMSHQCIDSSRTATLKTHSRFGVGPAASCCWPKFGDAGLICTYS